MLKAQNDKLSDALRLNSPWSIGEEGFANLCSDLGELSPTNIVEFGSGVSTARLATKFPDAHILAVDHSPIFAAKTNKLLRQHSLSQRARVSHRPIRRQVHHFIPYRSYAPGAFPAAIDAAIIDGPPAEFRYGREACLHQISQQLRVGGRVYLDDFRRSMERFTLANWLRVYGDCFDIHTLDAEHGICVLTKMRDIRARASFLIICEHLGIQAVSAMRAVKNRFTER